MKLQRWSSAVLCLALSMSLNGLIYGDSIVNPSDSMIVYTGRFDNSNPTEPIFGWSGTSIIANFEGTSITAQFDDLGDNHLYYIIDDGKPQPLDLIDDPKDYVLATGLSDGIHKVEIGKKTEGTKGEVKFLSLKLDEGKGLVEAPARPPLKFVFFGDSNQAGYSAECICDQGNSEHEDSYYTYPAITSRMLNAEYHNISASGITISDSPANWQIKDVWNKTYYGDGNGPTWSFDGEVPDAVVINLGANDFYAGQSKSQIKNGWKSFINDEVRGVYPNAHIVIANSYGWAINEPADYVNEAVEELHDEGDTSVSFVRFPWLWSQAHAVTFEHAGFANILAEHLANKLSLPQPAPNSLSSFAPPGQIPNGSFENSNLSGVPDGWRFFGTGSTYIEDAEDARSGSAFVRVDGRNTGFWHATDAIPGHRYEFSGWLREADSGDTGRVRIQFKDQAQQVLSTFQESKVTGAEWEQVSLTATAPEGAWQIAVSILAGGSPHSVEFDDLALVDLDAAAIDPADFNQDGDVDNVDLGIWTSSFGENSLADANGDGRSDGLDFLLWQSASHNSGASIRPVPEPSTLLMLMTTFGGLGAFGPMFPR